MSKLDERGNQDVMGPRTMTDAVKAEARALQLDFNALHAQLLRDESSNPESARLMAMSRSHLEIACMLAIKSLSRE